MQLVDFLIQIPLYFMFRKVFRKLIFSCYLDWLKKITSDDSKVSLVYFKLTLDGSKITSVDSKLISDNTKMTSVDSELGLILL